MNKVFIVNNFSNSGNGEKKWLHFKEHTSFFGQDDVIIDYLCQEKLAENLKIEIEQKINQGFYHFVAVGGDGTVNMLINALMELPSDKLAQIELGAIGVGSSNDFHKPFKNVFQTKWGDIPYRLYNTDKKFYDIACVEFNQQKKYFVNNASIGITAFGNNEFNQNKSITQFTKKLNTKMAILQASLLAMFKYKAQNLEINIGNQNIKNKFSNIGIIKNRHFAGDLLYPQGTTPNSGDFKLYLIEELNLKDSIKAFKNLENGNFPLQKGFTQYDAKSIQIKSDEKFYVEIDGEIFFDNDFKFTIANQGLNIWQ